jgi:hypothetical protein
MLKYIVNTRKLNKTEVKIPVESIVFVDFANLKDDETEEAIEYDGRNKDKLMVICKCSDIDKLINGSFINTVNTLYLNYGVTDMLYQDKFTFVQDYQIIGVNEGNKSFSFYMDKRFPLTANRITSSKNYGLEIEDNKENVFLYFDDYHYFDIVDSLDSESETEIGQREVPIFFKYVNAQSQITIVQVNFKYYTPSVLVTSYDNFGTDEQKGLYELIFKTEIDEETEEVLEGDLGGIEIYRDNFLFGDRTNYEFSFERATVHLNVPIINTFEANLLQTELLSEHFVEKEKKKAINRITDIEKDVYYPCISNLAKSKFTDVYTIKFNLHFREHREDDWVVENDSLWNGIKQEIEYVKSTDESVRITEEAYKGLTDEQKAEYVRRAVEGTAEIAKVTINDNGTNAIKALTKDDSSDLLTFLNFTNDDVHYQKNKLKKSFLRLLYFDSTNPGNQNLLGYSTIFFDTGDMFAKYVRYIEEDNCYSVGADKNGFGKYKETGKYKTGIRVDRDIDGDDTIRLGSQFVVRSKNTSKASSEGFYIYIWKDNNSPLPQDLYMKVEFNHAGYGRTLPFMMPYWDKKKWNNAKKGIKTLQEILDDWNAVKQENGTWPSGKDGHYGIRQYAKFSYIHLKYQYDRENDKHIYYLDPDTYDTSVTNQDENEIVINLYEAKVE